jgi:hypothetical protein
MVVNIDINFDVPTGKWIATIQRGSLVISAPGLINTEDGALREAVRKFLDQSNTLKSDIVELVQAVYDVGLRKGREPI